MMMMAHAKAEAEAVGEDRISELPDDILISIVSRLPLKEAVATSILSGSWRYLHIYTTRLDFPPFPAHTVGVAVKKKKNWRCPSTRTSTGQDFQRFVNMINGTLDSHKGSRIKELKINTYTIVNDVANPHKWLEFALTRKAETIEIKMRDFSESLVQRSTYFLGLEKLINIDINPTAAAVAAGLGDLKELSLGMINVTDHDLGLVISNCVALERLSIMECGRELRNILIVGHSKLKHLGISNVWQLKSMEIGHLTNLVSLEFSELHGVCDLKLHNLPKLIKFSTGEYHRYTSCSRLFDRMPPSLLHQLQILHLSSCLQLYRLALMMPLSFSFLNIKHLELEVEVVEMRSTANFDPLYRLIRACTSLETIQIKVSWESDHSTMVWKMIETFTAAPEPVIIRRKKLSTKLKKLEISGYSKSEAILNLAEFIMNHVACLEQLIVVPLPSPSPHSTQTNRIAALRDFQSITPPSLNLLIYPSILDLDT